MSDALRRTLAVASVAALALVVLIAGRRFAHHARLQLVPVVVPQGVEANEITQPSTAKLYARMGRDLREALAPPARPRLAVLTFDDGPYPVTTPALLAQLQALRVPATFFFIGDHAAQQPAIARRIAAGGMEIANHTLSHPGRMTALLLPAQQEEIVDGAVALRRITGARPWFFRPPHGDYDATTLFAAQSAGEETALWTIDPGDWREIDAATIARHVIEHATSPAVVLLHDGHASTVEALPGIVSAYRGAGYEFVTLRELRRRLTLDEVNDPLPVTLPAAGTGRTRG